MPNPSGYSYMNSALQLRHVCQIRCLRAEKLQEYCRLHVNHHILNKSERYTARGGAILAIFRPKKLPSRPGQWTLFHPLSRCLALLLRFDDSACSPSHENEVEVACRGMTFAAHAGTTAVNQGKQKKKKLWKLQQENLLQLRVIIIRAKSAHSSRLSAVISSSKYARILIKGWINCCLRGRVLLGLIMEYGCACARAQWSSHGATQ